MGFLSRTTEEEIQRTGDLGLAKDDPYRAIKAFLIENAALFGHGAEVLTNAVVARDFVTAHNGMRTTIWQQQLDGIPVFEGLLIGHITQNARLVNISSHFLPDIGNSAGLDRLNRLRLESAPAVSAAHALANALRDLGEATTVDAVSVVSPASLTPEKAQELTAAPLFGEARASLVWLSMNRSTVRLCWQVEFINRSSLESFRSLVDATSGEVLIRQNRTFRSNATYRIYPSDSPSPFSPGWTTPSSGQPALVNRTLVTLNAVSATASPAGWVEAGTNPRTFGNNVEATAWRCGFCSPSPQPHGPSRVFDFSLDLVNQEPDTYAPAATVNLFYWCNWMHDKLYDLGFTEAAGNFQSDNFGRGGASTPDPVLAYAQAGADCGDANNAFFSPAPDGSSGRIFMFTWNGPSPNRDGDFDEEVILHEYTHGLSDRLVGGGVGITALQTSGMAEGWSDFYALSLLSAPTDNVNGNYPAGGYVSYQLQRGTVTLAENYYYGIRRYPYSTDMTKSPLTFKDIDPGQASSHAGVALNPIYGPPTPFCALNDANSPCEPHFSGQVWCVTLWEARKNLIDRYGYPVGSTVILQLVTDGMNLCPPNPNFIQARDAIIQAVLVNDNCGPNWDDVWAAFMKRGMGGAATAPDSSTTAGVVESFAPPHLGNPCQE